MDFVASKKQGGFFVQYIHNRIKRNKNFVACITGPTGSGKSWSALRLAESIDPDFTIENLCFSPREFMSLVSGTTKQLKKGSVIVFDEVQVSMSHLDYQSLQSKMLNYVFQTFRHRNFILFMTSPHFNFINASLRRLFHARIETISINPNEKQVTLKPLLLQVNQDTGDVYRKYLRVHVKGQGVVPLQRMRVSMPSDELIGAYEEKKTAFTQGLNESIERDLAKLEKGSKDKNRPKFTPRQEEIIGLLLEHKTQNDIAKQLEIHPRVVRFHMNAVEKKGVKLIPIKKGSNQVLYYEIEGYEAT